MSEQIAEPVNSVTNSATLNVNDAIALEIGRLRLRAIVAEARLQAHLAADPPTDTEPEADEPVRPEP